MIRQILILPTTPDAPALLGQGESDLWEVSHIALDTLETHDWDDHVLVILPGQNIRSFETDLPKASRAQQIKAARFAHEDQIATSIDDLHVALSSGSPTITSFIDKDWLTATLEGLAKRGLTPKHVLADYDALQLLDAPVTVIDRVVTPGRAGHAQDMGWTAPPAAISDQALFAAISQSFSAGTTTNLLQDQFKPKSNVIGSVAGLTRFAGLAAACLIAFFAWQGVQARAMQKQASDLGMQSAALYTQTTGQAAPRNYTALAAQALQNPEAEGQVFLRLSNILFSAMSTMDDIQVDRMSYNPQRQELQLRLFYPDFDAAARLEQSMRQAGGDFIPGGVREQGDEFVGEAVLKIGGAS